MIVLPHSHIRLLAQIDDLDYFDTQTTQSAEHLTPLQVWAKSMAQPRPMLQWAFRIRDTISSWFGVRQIGGFTGAVVDNVQVGERLDFFTVEQVSDDALTMTERDRHLDVMICITCIDSHVTVTASVQVHNTFGRLYMIPVGIAHRWIVRAMLASV